MTCIDSGECSWADGTDGLAGLEALFNVAVGEETYSVITAEDAPWPTIAYEADIGSPCLAPCLRGRVGSTPFMFNPTLPPPFG